MGRDKEKDKGDDRGRSEKSLFSHSFSTTWRKALVSLPRVVPSSIVAHYNPSDGPKPFVLKLPSTLPNHHSIPVHIFLQLPSTGDTPPASAPTSRARSANNSPRRSGTSTPVSAPPSSIHGASTLTPASAAGTTHTDRFEQAFNDRENMSPAAIAARRSFESNSSSPSGTRPGPKPMQTHYRRPTLLLPVIIDFHGGSFILGSPSEQAPFCAYMCRSLTQAHPNTGCVVISVDYRLGPYSKFPAANEDADEIVKAVFDTEGPAGRVLREDIRQHIESMGWKGREGKREWVDLDTSRVAVSGFSSGGNLALNCVIDSPADPNRNGEDWPAAVPRDHRWPVPVLMFYPSFDARLLPDERPRPEGLDPPTGFFARWKIEDELMPKYLPVERRADVRASPGLGSVRDGLHPKAKMLLVLPELDSLSDQSWKWVDKVADEGRGEDLDVEHVKGEMHGWTQFPDSWIKTEESKKKKYDSFERASEFVGKWWYGQERVGSVTFGEMGDAKQ